MVIAGTASFIGSAVARAMQAWGATIVALVEPGANDRNLEGIVAERAVADVRDVAAVPRRLRGRPVRVSPGRDLPFLGARPADLLRGQRRGDAERARRGPGRRRASDWCSPPPSGCLWGWAGTRAGESADETRYADIAHLYGSYKRSKYAAEHEVLRACAEGLDLSIVLPTFPLGPG